MTEARKHRASSNGLDPRDQGGEAVRNNRQRLVLPFWRLITCDSDGQEVVLIWWCFWSTARQLRPFGRVPSQGRSGCVGGGAAQHLPACVGS